jgi:hypothetical protein
MVTLERRPVDVDISIPPRRSSAVPLALNPSVLLAHLALHTHLRVHGLGTLVPVAGLIVCASTPEPPVWTRCYLLQHNLQNSRMLAVTISFTKFVMHEQVHALR